MGARLSSAPPPGFEGFAVETVDTGEVAIHARVGGAGPPLLLLHGYPETHVMWHAIAGQLARDFTVVAADLRGYGDSGKPAPTPDHATYAKRAMARDQVAAMRRLGFERFAVAGHDRGGRVAYRLALDHPERVERVALLDVVPTLDMLARVDRDFALAFWHWFLLAQPPGVPEALLAADAESLLFGTFAGVLGEAQLTEYRRCAADPATQRAICEDYRAQMTVDLVHDRADRARGRRIVCPLLALWGARGLLPSRWDVLAVWRAWAADVRGEALPCGHFLPEEAPAETLAALRAFLLA